MSLGGRAYNILRGYVGREWDRIQGVEADVAEQELLEYLPPTAPATQSNNVTQQVAEDRDEHARKILGVTQDSSFSDIRKAFDRLNGRSDPDKFPIGSPEAKQAAEIQRRVQWAYQFLTRDVDPTEKRFGSLEV